MWRRDLDELGTYWLLKFPDVSFRQVLESCLFHSAQGRLPCHSQFFYPKRFGYGEWISRLAEYLKSHIVYRETVTCLDWKNLIVNNKYSADKIITTIPWTEISSSFPKPIRQLVSKLQFTSIDIDYFPNNSANPSHWTYFSDPNVQYHRIIFQHNCSFDKETGFCAKGFWTETNTLANIEPSPFFHFQNKYAYPVSLIDKPESIKRIRSWAEKYGIYGVGRWGEWDHLNSDVAMNRGMLLAQELMKM